MDIVHKSMSGIVHTHVGVHMLCEDFPFVFKKRHNYAAHTLETVTYTQECVGCMKKVKYQGTSNPTGQTTRINDYVSRTLYHRKDAMPMAPSPT